MWCTRFAISCCCRSNRLNRRDEPGEGGQGTVNMASEDDIVGCTGARCIISSDTEVLCPHH
jgi:hypothetical protein